MDRVIDFILKNKNEILVGIIVTVCSTFIVFFFQRIVIIKRKFYPKSMPDPKEQAVYLNTLEKPLEVNCIGRHELLEVVFSKIADGSKNLFTRKCIAITGEEGIGKTLFCYTLFQYYLQKSPVYLGWIECNGKQSIFDIVKKTFEDLRFRRKEKDDILGSSRVMVGKNTHNPSVYAD